jgi:hypothetical protein
LALTKINRPNENPLLDPKEGVFIQQALTFQD